LGGWFRLNNSRHADRARGKRQARLCDAAMSQFSQNRNRCVPARNAFLTFRQMNTILLRRKHRFRRNYAAAYNVLRKFRSISPSCNNLSKVFLMRFTVLLSSLLLAGVVSVGASVSPATTVVSSSSTTSVATPALVPACPPKLCP
jgi:hypothetical protein